MTVQEKKPGEDGLVRLTCEGGALLESLAWEDHPTRATNYLAIVEVDPTKPGGLNRRFVNKGRGDCFYLTDPFGVFDVLEFAADYTTFNGSRRRQRFYAIVVRKTPSEVTLKPCAKGAEACVIARKLREETEAELARVRVVV